ncbi:RNA-guided pseudouridylation complex pseudouridine synthase subunit Cbf5 [Candidatus Woesearchaeota archaeon]|jgi:H/ACA ribonucleoprotein complex subunit 4|nr:RNA-guided pseudouridylation complex pseudouridine synthase subunit Cbf5 [Candidatus Woesearchaeota archaeon]MDP6648324.1 RNA-guided pseudouridylation complex pseudouridine synthase subunit Cbf5 [Candidatus Woesearchaeota archaeon]|tara:strand:- start:5787 stop:6773 length:987 start_codon:yes stop_codon:yes gene_type:complete
MQNLLPFEKIERKIVVRQEAETDNKLGCKPQERKTEEIINYGIVNIDKPKGPTSHQVSDFVQKILKINKSGHSGTLDPAVTGLLPIALGNATRIVQNLLIAGKEYVAIMHLHKNIDENKLKETIEKNFLGKIKQMPPLKSSIKRQLRTRSIYYIDILEIDNQDVLFKVGSEAGTYIRKLIHDIGQKLEIGAHMAELRRTKAGPFTESSVCTLQELTDAYYFWKQENNDKFLRKIIQPIENGVSHLPKVWVFDTTVESLCHGSDLKVPGISKVNDKINKEETVAIMTLKDELVALGTAKMDSNEMLGERGLAVKTEKVFMNSDLYKIIK